jgi:DNA-binding PadR family transcriptional regulator
MKKGNHMSPIDLVILGFLRKTPMSAYQLTKFVETTRMKKWMKIGSPTIYQNLKKLAADNFLSTEVAKEGNMPEKVIYTITPSGEAYLLELMERFSGNPGKIHFEFNAFLIHLQLVNKKTGLKMLGNLRDYFYRGREDLERDLSELQDVPLAGKALMRQYQFVFQGLIRWIDELIQQYQQT